MTREFGGLILRWADAQHASRYDIAFSDDGNQWRTVREVAGSNGGMDPLMLPESEARFVRLKLLDGPGQFYELSEVEIKNLAFGKSPNAFFEAIAGEAARGQYPRSFSGEQAYWTVVGIDGGHISGRNVGDIQTLDNIEASRALRLYEAWLSRDYDPRKTEQIYEMEPSEREKPLFRVRIANRESW